MTAPRVRKGQASTEIDRAEFGERFRGRFVDPAFDPLRAEIARLEEVAWDGYTNGRKAPRTRVAGDEFADPSYELSIDWLDARLAIRRAEAEHADRDAPTRILVVAGGDRNEHTCPGEMSKTIRMAELAREAIEQRGGVVDLLDLSRMTAEYGRTIHPCKGCVSTAMPLCHWPCSCYPNHALGQVGDWMNELYPRWIAAHGVLIVTPVYWLQTPSALKLMIDRLVCADGGNPDPTTTSGKDPAKAKAIELEGWSYPRHLAGRAFGVVVHGDTEGIDRVRQSLVEWMQEMELVHVGQVGGLARYIGYFEPYATSHDAFDRDRALHQETRAAAAAVIDGAAARRRGERLEARGDLESPRPK